MLLKQPGVLGKISIKITVALLLALICLALIIIFVLFPTFQDNLKFAVAVIGGAAAIYGGYYAAITFHLSLQEKKKEHSFDFLRILNQLDMYEVRKIIEHEIECENISPNDLYNKIKSDLRLCTSVETTLGFFEDISIAIQENYADERILYLSVGYTAPWLFRGLQHFIHMERKKCEDNTLFIEIEKLADAWKVNKSIINGEYFLKGKYHN